MEDRARLDKITDNMAAQIHRVIYGRNRDPRSERVLHGGRLRDRFGHQWMLSTHIEDVDRAELDRRMASGHAEQ